MISRKGMTFYHWTLIFIIGLIAMLLFLGWLWWKGVPIMQSAIDFFT